MSDKQTFLAELIKDLKQQRDELRVRIHLGSVELKEELNKLDDRLAELNDRFEPLKGALGETAEDVWESLKLVGGEIKEGFDRIRKSL
jgi:uncharacterized coiled-coil DUF342 family protein